MVIHILCDHYLYIIFFCVWASELFWSKFVRVCRRRCHLFTFSSPSPISIKLGIIHPLLMGTQVCTNKRPRSFLRGYYNEIAKMGWWNLNIFSRTDGPNFNQTGHKVSMGKKDLIVIKWKAFLRSENNTQTKFKNLLPQNHWPISTKLVTYDLG